MAGHGCRQQRAVSHIAVQRHSHSGLGNILQSEAVRGALPQHQNNPQKPPLGLYAEQISGTVPRSQNKWAWFYRRQPSVQHGPVRYTLYKRDGESDNPPLVFPIQLRWSPIPIPDEGVDFVDGLRAVARSGTGATACIYTVNKSMSTERRFYTDTDSELLLVPQGGRLLIRTEFGELHVGRLEICVIPRGVKFQVDLIDATARGYALENHGTQLQLPELGVIGASSGLAAARHFIAPLAQYDETINEPCTLITRFQGATYIGEARTSPFDVVAWFGSLWPYKYDLRSFTCINSVTHDHPDPSIYTGEKGLGYVVNVHMCMRCQC
ncbi:unnamed protein product [Vitrella brassicaformis CCMP3155]|uniref:homogentisate 1,2-dioxygenase n=1 Tax=Vitrella brassicaformis (strain CCMP3155) TaxID=1169540 RepID=A0A0G4EBE2_VITBC|nr:unnamed protein product [Vitrella brassicaformis CCMP3155]|eukprot:CEL93278.1 unnamed protein product [Vitrella brassicaformis CCMP3155]